MPDKIDYEIAALINSYIEKARRSIHKEGVDLIGEAFQLIKTVRQEKCLSDEIYSSAEHYLTARYFSSLISGGAMVVASLSYDLYKLSFGLGETKKLGLGNSCPVSKLSFKQTKWKMLGCLHGKDDMFLRTRHIYRVTPDWSIQSATIGVGT